MLAALAEIERCGHGCASLYDGDSNGVRDLLFRRRLANARSSNEKLVESLWQSLERRQCWQNLARRMRP